MSKLYFVLYIVIETLIFFSLEPYCGSRTNHSRQSLPVIAIIMRDTFRSLGELGCLCNVPRSLAQELGLRQQLQRGRGLRL
jgi:hypothetical protein